MKKVMVLLLIVASSALAFAQEKNPVSSVIRQILPRREDNLVTAAEQMPADKYSFKPTAEQMTFAKLVLHITESNNFLCAKAGDVPEPKVGKLEETDGKDKLVAALKASFDFCTTALAKVDDSQLGEPVELFGGRKGTRAFALFALSNDWSDHYSAAAQYLRLNGMLPPTAQKKK
jgi:uncharacterized damage-inducible protein DinB